MFKKVPDEKRPYHSLVGSLMTVPSALLLAHFAIVCWVLYFGKNFTKFARPFHGLTMVGWVLGPLAFLCAAWATFYISRRDHRPFRRNIFLAINFSAMVIGIFYAVAALQMEG